MSLEEKERKNRRIGLLVSVGSHLAVLLLFVFLVAWRAPNPPLPEIGIELNFGTSDTGMGEAEPETEPADTETGDAAPDSPAEEINEEPVEETVDEPEQETVSEPVTDTPAEEEPLTDVPADVPAEEEPTPEKDRPTEEEKPAEEPPELHEVIQYPDPNKNKNNNNINKGDSNDNGNNQLNDGGLDGREEDLNMPGWVWENPPKPKHGDVESGGKITFKFTVNEKGEVIDVKSIPTTTAEQWLINIYKDALYKATLKKTNGRPPERTEGKITYIIKAN